MYIVYIYILYIYIYCIYIYCIYIYCIYIYICTLYFAASTDSKHIHVPTGFSHGHIDPGLEIHDFQGFFYRNV